MSHPIPVEELEEALKLLAVGKNLREVAEDLGRDRTGLSRRLRETPEIEARYEQAVKDGIETKLELAFEMAHKAATKEDIAKARLIADNAKWDASKRHAAVYGDKIDSNLTEPLNIILGITRRKIADKTVISEQ